MNPPESSSSINSRPASAWGNPVSAPNLTWLTKQINSNPKNYSTRKSPLTFSEHLLSLILPERPWSGSAGTAHQKRGRKLSQKPIPVRAFRRDPTSVCSIRTRNYFNASVTWGTSEKYFVSSLEFSTYINWAKLFFSETMTSRDGPKSFTACAGMKLFSLSLCAWRFDFCGRNASGMRRHKHSFFLFILLLIFIFSLKLFKYNFSPLHPRSVHPFPKIGFTSLVSFLLFWLRYNFFSFFII